MNQSIAGVVILYHPDITVYHNIQTYISEIDTLYVLDNTELPDNNIVDRLRSCPKVQYIAFNDNKGIAYALNYALVQAQSEGYVFLLTMDQDSSFSEDNLREYMRRIEVDAYRKNDVVSYAVNYGPLNKEKVERQLITSYITSGSVLDVSKAIAIGKFDERLFIDQVDSEFAYRATVKGNRIITFFDIYLNHHLGNIRWYHLGRYKFAVLNHGPLRKYYIFRNLIYVRKKYPFLKNAYRTYIVKEFIKVLLFEKEKATKFKYIFFAFRDAYRKQYGKYKIHG